MATASKWFEANPPDNDGYWYCYLRISTLCPYRLNRSLVTLEHVYPKKRWPEVKYCVENIKPACAFCNKMKGSRSIKRLARAFPHIAVMINAPEWRAWEAKLPLGSADKID